MSLRDVQALLDSKVAWFARAERDLPGSFGVYKGLAWAVYHDAGMPRAQFRIYAASPQLRPDGTVSETNPVLFEPVDPRPDGKLWTIPYAKREILNMMNDSIREFEARREGHEDEDTSISRERRSGGGGGGGSVPAMPEPSSPGIGIALLFGLGLLLAMEGSKRGGRDFFQW